MTFADPRWLAGLLALPLLAAIELFAAYRARRALERLVGGRRDHALLSEIPEHRRATSAVLRLLAVALLMLGAAQPQWGREAVRRGATGSDVALLVDVSASMDARDVPPSRIDEARREALAVIDRLGGSRVGVVGFAGEAVRLCPLTLDRAAARLTVEALNTFTIAEPGTDLGKGLRTALRLFPPGRRDEQAIVLWTDGEDLEQGARVALDEVARTGVRVFAVGVGTPAGDVVPMLDDQGRAVDVKRDENGNAVRSRLDEGLLREIARRTHGAYFAAARPGGELPRLLGALGGIAQSGRGNRLIERPVARFPWFAGAAALVLLVERWWTRRRRRVFETALATTSGQAAAAAAVLLLWLALPRPAAAQSAWARGDREFRSEHYAAAESLYTLRLRDRHAPDAVRVDRATARALAGHGPQGLAELQELAARQGRPGLAAEYNLGTLLGQAKQNDPALAALRRTLERDPHDQDARWNYEVILRRQQQQQQQQQQKQQPKNSQNRPSPSQPQPQAGQNPNPQPQPKSGTPPAPQPEPRTGAQQGMDRPQAEQLLDALQELQRMDQQRQRKVRVLKERRGRDW